MKRYTLTLLAIAISSILLAQEGIQFTTGSWDAILKKAKNENKNIFIDCYTSWCGPCKKLTAYTFPLKEVGDYYNPKFVSIQIDMEKEGDGVMLQKKFDVHLFPTMIICNDKGEELHRFTGFISGEKVIQEAKKINGGKVLAYYENEYAAGNRQTEFVKEYIDYLNSGYQKAKLSPIADKYLISIGSEKWKSEESWKIISSYMNDKTGNSPVTKYVQKNVDAYNTLYGEKEVAKVLTRRFYESAKLFYTKENDIVTIDYPAFNQYIMELRELNVENVDNIKLNADIHYAHLTNDWDEYVKLVEQKIESKKVSAVGIWIYANNVHEDCDVKRVKKEAFKWCDDGLKIATRERRIKLLSELKVKLEADISLM